MCPCHLFAYNYCYPGAYAVVIIYVHAIKLMVYVWPWFTILVTAQCYPSSIYSSLLYLHNSYRLTYSFICVMFLCFVSANGEMCQHYPLGRLIALVTANGEFFCFFGFSQSRLTYSSVLPTFSCAKFMIPTLFVPIYMIVVPTCRPFLCRYK